MSKSALKSTRQGYGDALLELSTENEQVVALAADLTDSTKTDQFAHSFPKRFIEVGIQEQNMAGIASGLAHSGKIPFMASYSVFNPGRNWEQIRLSIAYSNTNVKIVGTHAGLSPSADGATHQALEDIALTRVLPNMTVINPIDYNQAFLATKAAAKHIGPVYIRLIRENTPEITTQKDTFTIGQVYELKEGTDITIFTTGTITTDAIHAAHTLKTKHNLSCAVIAVPTIKPLDSNTILKHARLTKKIVTVEEHQVSAGFGSAITEIISQENPMPIKIIGIEDTFTESGTYSELKDKYGINEHQIVNKILEFNKKWQ